MDANTRTSLSESLKQRQFDVRRIVLHDGSKGKEVWRIEYDIYNARITLRGAGLVCECRIIAGIFGDRSFYSCVSHLVSGIKPPTWNTTGLWAFRMTLLSCCHSPWAPGPSPLLLLAFCTVRRNSMGTDTLHNNADDSACVFSRPMRVHSQNWLAALYQRLAMYRQVGTKCTRNAAFAAGTTDYHVLAR